MGVINEEEPFCWQSHLIHNEYSYGCNRYKKKKKALVRGGQKAELWGLPLSAASLNKLSQQVLAHGWLCSVAICCGMGTKAVLEDASDLGCGLIPKCRPREKQREMK